MSAAETPADCTARRAVVAVESTVLWSALDSPRGVDAAALATRPDLIAWAESLDNDARRDLLNRADTHALLGEPVIVVSGQDGWSEVRLPLQPSAKNPLGYPGWLPTAHLTDPPAPTGAPLAAVTGAHWIEGSYSDGESARLSFGTVLPSIDNGDGTVTLEHPSGRSISVSAIDVSSLAAAPGLPLSARALERGRLFTGIPYLWAGLSGAGVDCSGLVHLSYRSLGVVVPRDADDQELVGSSVSLDEALPGDAFFFANDSGVHHVAFVAGAGGSTFHAPRTGEPVGEGRTDDPAYAGETITAARFLVPLAN
jgi:hypothetical protein